MTLVEKKNFLVLFLTRGMQINGESGHVRMGWTWMKKIIKTKWCEAIHNIKNSCEICNEASMFESLKVYINELLYIIFTTKLICLCEYSVISSYLLGGIPPRIPNPLRKTPKIQKNIKKCIEFTPQICVPPRTWSLELTLMWVYT